MCAAAVGFLSQGQGSSFVSCQGKSCLQVGDGPRGSPPRRWCLPACLPAPLRGLGGGDGRVATGAAAAMTQIMMRPSIRLPAGLPPTGGVMIMQS